MPKTTKPHSVKVSSLVELFNRRYLLIRLKKAANSQWQARTPALPADGTYYANIPS
jgi:hypothetical protein